MKENIGEKNQRIVNQAKEKFLQKDWESAIKLFSQSIECCKIQKWSDGVIYAEGMIEDCQDMIDLYDEEESLNQTEKSEKEFDKSLEESIKKRKQNQIIESKSGSAIKEDKIEEKGGKIEEMNTEKNNNVEKSESKKLHDEVKKVTASNQSSDNKIISGLMVQKGKGRTECPKCGNYNPNMIREVKDINNILMDYPKVYGKKFICGKCGTEFKRKKL